MMTKQFVPQIQVRSNVRSGAGGYVDGVWYPDMSGVCGGVQPNPPQPYPPQPYPPQPGGGGYVNGVWYPDRSGVCG